MKIGIFPKFNADEKAALQAQLSDLDSEANIVFKENISVQNFADIEVILGNPPVDLFVNLPKNLKLWVLETAGFEKYKDLIINAPVCNMQDYFSIPCAETTVAGILAFYRRIDELTTLKNAKKWVGDPIRITLSLLWGKKVVILGYGSIGGYTKKMLEGFNCEVTTMARTNPEADIHTVEQLMDILPTTELLINCLPGSAGQFVTAEMLQKLPKNAVVTNVGRGNTIDEAALIKLLQTNQIAGAVLDVTALEPLPESSPLWSLPNVILTQHSAGGQMSEFTGKVAYFIENFSRFIKNEPLLNQIDLSRGY